MRGSAHAPEMGPLNGVLTGWDPHRGTAPAGAEHVDQSLRGSVNKPRAPDPPRLASPSMGSGWGMAIARAFPVQSPYNAFGWR